MNRSKKKKIMLSLYVPIVCAKLIRKIYKMQKVYPSKTYKMITALKRWDQM